MVLIKSHNPQMKGIEIQTAACLYLWYGNYAVICFLECQQTGWRFLTYYLWDTVHSAVEGARNTFIDEESVC